MKQQATLFSTGKKVKKNSHLRIVDKKGPNFFGVMFFDEEWTEAIQALSGMEGEYTTEYQVHYWSLVGRGIYGEQIIDFIFPVLFYNYEQDVGGASVSFHLSDVEEAGEDTREEAKEKADELLKDEFIQKLKEKFNLDWELVPMGSIHAHPGNGIHKGKHLKELKGEKNVVFSTKDDKWYVAQKTGVSGFSGTDYKKNVNQPGVVYPMNKGTLVPSPSLIMQHKDGISEPIHAEYRIFNREGNNLVYYHGNMTFISRGRIWEEPKVEAPEPSIVNEFFGVEPEIIKEEEPKEYLYKILIDGRHSVNENIVSLMTDWSNVDFTPEFEIDKDLIDEGTTHRGIYSGGFYSNGYEVKSGNEYHVKRKRLIEELVSLGYDRITLTIKTNNELEQMVKNLKKNNKSGRTPMRQLMIDYGFSEKDLEDMSEEEIAEALKYLEGEFDD